MNKNWLTRLTFAVLLVAVLASPRAASPAMFGRFLDVGQGDAIWIKAPGGVDILIDGGPTSTGEAVVSYLFGHGCTGIDFMVLTHPHEDHVGGLNEVLARMPVDYVLYNGQAYDSLAYNAWLAATEGVRSAVYVGEQFDFDGVAPRVVHGDSGDSNANNNILAIVVSYGTFDVLLTGHMETPAEAALLASGEPIASEVLKVGEHGSGSSSWAPFLHAVDARTAVISVGLDKLYGHPAAGTLSNLVVAGAAVFRTDLDGTVTITSDGSSYSVTTQNRADATATAVPTGRPYLAAVWHGVDPVSTATPTGTAAAAVTETATRSRTATASPSKTASVPTSTATRTSTPGASIPSRTFTRTRTSTARPSATRTPIPGGGTVYITESGSKYHRGGCSYLAHSKIAKTCSWVVANGYTPCSVCKPVCP